MDGIKMETEWPYQWKTFRTSDVMPKVNWQGNLQLVIMDIEEKRKKAEEHKAER